MTYILPQDGYDTNLTTALNAGDTEAFVNILPTETSGILSVYEPDGRTLSEKIYYTGVSASPNKLTGLIRDIRRVAVGGVILFTSGGNPLDHSSNVRIAMTDNINYTGVALAVLNGDMEMGGVMQLPAVRSINSARDVVDKEYADGLSVGVISQLLVTKNGANPTLTINIATGRYIVGNDLFTYAGGAAIAVTAASTNYVMLRLDGTIVINTTGFLTSGHIPLSIVVTNGTTITSVTDARAFFTIGDADKLITTKYTYGATIAINNILYIDTADSKWKLADASVAATSDATFGIALEAGVNNDTNKRVATPGSIVTGFVGLTPGLVYLSDTAGGVSSTPGTYKKVIGFAPNTTTIIFYPQLRIEDLAGTNTDVTTSNLNSLMSAYSAGSLVSINSLAGDGSDGNVTIAAPTTLTRDMFYNNLTINVGQTLSTGGYRIFVKGTLTNNGTISNNGGNGAAGTAGSGAGGGAGGAGGTVAPGNAVFAGEDGKAGGIGDTGNGPGCAIGTAGDSVTSALGVSGVTGGAGGGGGSGTVGGGAGCAGGAAGTATATIYKPFSGPLAVTFQEFNASGNNPIKNSAGSGAGGGGGEGGQNAGAGNPGGGGGGGGGSGATGGTVLIIATTIINSATGIIQANGGTGGIGGAGAAGPFPVTGGAGGGGGGAGGSGGVVFLVYQSISNLGTIQTLGGTGGVGGTFGLGNGGGTNGTAGSTGNSGLSGVVYEIIV